MPTTELITYIRARYTLIYLLSAEEERVLTDLRALAADQKKSLFTWSHASGLRGPGVEAGRALGDPLGAVDAVDALADQALIVLLDFHPFLDDAGVVRKVRELAIALEASHKTVLFLSPTLVLPLELQKDVVVVDVPLPDEGLIRAALDEIVAALPTRTRAVLSERDAALLVRTAQGLTVREFTNAIAKAIVSRGRVDRDAIDIVNTEKRQIVRKSGILDYYPVAESFDAVGGLDELKRWLESRGRGFSDAARAFGLPFPRGVLIVGVQGCGKSLSAKAVAAAWRLPLIKLDMGRLFAGLVGASEEKMRQATRLAEATAPCVLWIDEIEKGLSGLGSSNTSDGGTTARVVGTFLTWMQEKTQPVFVIATSNDIAAMPPELLRKGRFDEIFFVDLPADVERRAIFVIHLARRGRLPADFDLDALVAATRGYSGAEIEQCVIDGMYRAFERARVLQTEDIVASAQETVPLSVLMEEKIGKLREWARYRTRPATGKMTRSEQDLATIAQRISRVTGES